MFGFLKKILRNEESAEVKQIREIRLYELEEWLNEKSKPMMEELKLQTDEILMKVDEEVQRARINVEVLENAKLQNQNIPFKAKQYMEGNRKAYIRAINSFLGHMEINNKDYFYLAEFCKLFDELMNKVNKETLRSYTILQEFFAHETSKMAQNLKNFDNLFSKLKLVLNNESVVAVNNAIERTQSLRTKSKLKINLDVDFKSREAELKLANNEKDSVMAEIEKFTKSEEHNNFLNLNDEKKNKTISFYNNQNQIMQSFSALERALRKYSHVAFEHEEIVLEYLNEPIEALANDKNFVILDVLKNLEKLLIENELQIDDKKKEKSLEEIKKLNKGFIELFVKKYYSFKSEIEEIDSKIKATGIAEKFKQFNEKLDDINLRIERLNEEFKKLGNDVAKADNEILSLKNDIETSIRDMFNEEIKVVI